MGQQKSLTYERRPGFDGSFTAGTELGAHSRAMQFPVSARAVIV